MDDGLSAGGGGEPTDSLEIFSSRPTPQSVEHVPAEHPPLDTPLSLKSQTKMSRSIVEIFELEEESTSEDEEMGDDDNEPVVDLEDQRRRTNRLRGVLPTLAQLWWSDSDQIVLVAEKLGDGSRDRKLFLFSENSLPLSAPADCISIPGLESRYNCLKSSLFLKPYTASFDVHANHPQQNGEYLWETPAFSASS